MMRCCYLLVLFSYLLFQIVKAEHIKIGLPVEINELDPFDLNLLEETEVFASVYDPLISYNVLTGFEPGIAKSWEFDNTKKTIIFHLKSGITFSDDTPITAKDVEYTLKRLILIDKDESLTLTKCLSSNAIKYNNINKNHPLIHTTNSGAIIIGPTNCGEQLLKELGDPAYGVISRKFVNKDLKVQSGAPVSGAFTYKKNISGFSLIPNIRNWRWEKAINKNLILDFIKIDQDFSSVKANSVDLYRTSNRTMLTEATNNGYHLVISIPIMVWFITTDNENLKSALPILNFLNSDIGKRNFSVFLKNPLEVSAESFFPNEFNCQSSPGKKLIKDLKYKKDIIRLINHKSRESEIYINDIKNELESNGHTVLIDDQKNNTTDKVVTLYLRRQFFGDGTLGTMNYTFRTVKTIPDPERQIINNLEQLFQDKLKPTEKEKLFKKTCQKLQFFNHVPLAHRKYAFFYKNEKFKDIFSKGNGTIIYNKLIK